MYVHISFSRNEAANTAMTSKIGSERRPKYLQRSPLLVSKG